MDLYTRVKQFFGLPYKEDQNKPKDSPGREIEEVNPREPFWERTADDYEKFGFDVFSNPVEMHRYFEQQMNHVLKSFGMFHEEGHFGNEGDLFFGGRGDPFFEKNPFNDDFDQLPALEESKKNKDEGSLREQYLKSGYEAAVPNKHKRSDKDLDGKFDMRDFDSVLQGKPSQLVPKTRFFGKSIVSKTIRNPDGTYEIHKTIRDHSGNEQTTITRGQGDKQYTITTKTNREGNQEIVEDMVNIDEHDKDSFIKSKTLPDENKPPNWFPFDKFFK